MKNRIIRWFKIIITKMKKEDGCWNCINRFDKPKHTNCIDCKDYDEWLEIDDNPYDYSMNEVY